MIGKYGVEDDPQSGHFELSFREGESGGQTSKVPALDVVRSVEKDAPYFFDVAFSEDKLPISAHRYGEFGMCSFKVNRGLIKEFTAIEHKPGGLDKEILVTHENFVPGLLDMDPRHYFEIMGKTIHGNSFNARVSYVPPKR